MMSDLKQQEHYTQYPKEFEPIEIIKGWLTPEEYKGYLKGNILKYIGRYRFKNGIQDLEKALVYAQWFNDFELMPYSEPKSVKAVANIWFEKELEWLGKELLYSIAYTHSNDTEKIIKDLIELVKKEQGQ